MVTTCVLLSLVELLCVHGARVFEDDDVTRSDSLSGRRKRGTCHIVGEDGECERDAEMIVYAAVAVVENVLVRLNLELEGLLFV